MVIRYNKINKYTEIKISAWVTIRPHYYDSGSLKETYNGILGLDSSFVGEDSRYNVYGYLGKFEDSDYKSYSPAEIIYDDLSRTCDPCSLALS